MGSLHAADAQQQWSQSDPTETGNPSVLTRPSHGSSVGWCQNMLSLKPPSCSSSYLLNTWHKWLRNLIHSRVKSFWKCYQIFKLSSTQSVHQAGVHIQLFNEGRAGRARLQVPGLRGTARKAVHAENKQCNQRYTILWTASLQPFHSHSSGTLQTFNSVLSHGWTTLGAFNQTCMKMWSFPDSLRWAALVQACSAVEQGILAYKRDFLSQRDPWDWAGVGNSQKSGWWGVSGARR